MKSFGFMLRAAVIALALLSPAAVHAQTVTGLPVYTQNQPSGAVVDLGNGAMELRVLQGNAQVFVVNGSGSGGSSALAFYPTGAATTLILSATPTTPPCVGCIIAGQGIINASTVIAYDGGTKITLASLFLAASPQTFNWGGACPATLGGQAAMLVQSGVGADLPLYTQARVCAAGQNTVGATLLPFAIGAH